MYRLYKAEDAHAIDDLPMRSVTLQRFAELADYGEEFEALGEFWIVEPADNLGSIAHATGLRLVQNRPTAEQGLPWQQQATDFIARWELIQKHETCYEMVFVLSDDGFGKVLWIPRHTGVDTWLLDLCAKHIIPADPAV